MIWLNYALNILWNVRYTTSLRQYYPFNLYLKEKRGKYKISRLSLLEGTDVCTRFKIPRAADNPPACGNVGEAISAWVVRNLRYWYPGRQNYVETTCTRGACFRVTAESYRVKFPSYRYICLLPHRNRIRASNLQCPDRKYLFSNPHVRITTMFCRRKCELNSKEGVSHDSRIFSTFDIIAEYIESRGRFLEGHQLTFFLQVSYFFIFFVRVQLSHFSLNIIIFGTCL